jgi:hypothetical protein
LDSGSDINAVKTGNQFVNRIHQVEVGSDRDRNNGRTRGNELGIRDGNLFTSLSKIKGGRRNRSVGNWQNYDTIFNLISYIFLRERSKEAAMLFYEKNFYNKKIETQ